MEKEKLRQLKEELSKLSKLDEIERRLYLKKLANGTYQGPPVGYASIDQPWLKQYSDDAIRSSIPMMKAYEYMRSQNSSESDLNRIAISYFGNNITYRKLYNNIEKVAKALKAKGIGEGDTVTIAMATSPELAYVLYAINRVGATANIIDPRLKTEEIISKVDKTDSKLFIGLDMAVSNIKNEKSKTSLKDVVVVSPIESAPFMIKTLMKLKMKDSKENCTSWKDFLLSGSSYNGNIDTEYVENKPAIIVYTGGTTGDPKGVMLTNENLNAMALIQKVSDYNINRDDTFLNFLPPFSAYSIVNALHEPLCLGFKTYLVPLFKPEDFPNLMRKFKPNHVMSGPILWDIMIRDKKSQKEDLSYLKSPISGGDSLPLQMENDINDFLSSHGCKYKIQQGYGMTEVSAAAVYSTERLYTPGSVGAPFVTNILATFDPETHEELGINQEGEIRISTPTMMYGYNKNQAATDDIIKVDPDGKRWISTGDLGRIDSNGNVFLIGRIKRMIVRSGNKIFPSNIENIISKIDGVEQCCIVGAPNKKEKTVPVAYMVIDEDHYDCENELIEEAKKKISIDFPEFNIPTKFIFRNELPLTDMAKIDFKKLEAESVDLPEDEIIIQREKENVKTLKR